MKRHKVLLLLAFVFNTVEAKTVYVTDNLELPLRSEESNKGKIISLLPTGTPLILIEENAKTGFSKVQLKSGMQGFISTRNTMPEPPNRSRLASSEKNTEALQTENATLRQELDKLKAVMTPGTPLEQSLANDRDRLERELLELKKTASNQMQLKNERDQVQTKLVEVDRKYQQLKLENDVMKNGATMDWFLYGGLLALGGVLLGFILPKLSMRRSGWDRL